MPSARSFVDDLCIQRQVLEEFRERGFFQVTDLFDEGQLAHMRQAWAEISDARRLEGRKPYATLLMTHVTNQKVAEIVRNPLLTRCVELTLGGKVELIQSQLMYGTPGNKGFSPHQDNYYNKPEPRDGIVAVWIALEDVGRENGALALFPGSHRHGPAPTRQDWAYLLTRSPDIAKSLLRMASPRFRSGEDDSSVIERFIYAEPPPELKPVDLEMKAGSVALFHGDTIHYSYPNATSDRWRRSLLTNYIRVGTTFSAGRLTGRTPFDVYATANA